MDTWGQSILLPLSSHSDTLEGGTSCLLTVSKRKFWRQQLRRLKYHNSDVEMNVRRHYDNDPKTTTAGMRVYLDSPPPPSADDSTTLPRKQETKEFNILNLGNLDILNELVRITRAQPVDPTPKELQEMRYLEEQTYRGEKDRRLSLEVRARVKREKELLEQARGELAAQPSR